MSTNQGMQNICICGHPKNVHTNGTGNCTECDKSAAFGGNDQCGSFKPMHKKIDVQEIREVLKILPHRYPFVMTDRVLSCEPAFDPPQIRSLKNVSINEPFFQGHFPGGPIMPGVLMLEGMAQSAGILLFHLLKGASVNNTVPAFFSGIDKAKFRKQVVPGD